MAVGAILLGAVLIGFNRDLWDIVVMNLPRGHGVHIRDIAGMGLLALGAVVLWHSPRSHRVTATGENDLG